MDPEQTRIIVEAVVASLTASGSSNSDVISHPWPHGQEQAATTDREPWPVGPSSSDKYTADDYLSRERNSNPAKKRFRVSQP